MIKVERFGYTKTGEEVLSFTLFEGVSYVKILNLGGIIQSIVVPDKNGVLTDVVLGYNDVAGYENNDGYLGALIGRFGNRIDKGRFTLDGKEYTLYCNDKSNHLHGGKSGFNAKIWAHEIKDKQLVLSILSPDGEEGYPGNLKVQVAYSFINKELKINYYAVSDKKTVVSLTNHAYFNLDGEGAGNATKNELWIDSDYIAPTDDELIPRGGFKAVKDTPFDFNEVKPIGKDIDGADEDIRRGGGYDHCYLLKNTCGEWVKYAVARGITTGITMTCYTDMPAVQFYAGNFLNQEGKTCFYKKRAGYCLETQAIPNNVNVEEYASKGSSVLEAGKEYVFTASYCF